MCTWFKTDSFTYHLLQLQFQLEFFQCNTIFYNPQDLLANGSKNKVASIESKQAEFFYYTFVLTVTFLCLQL